MKYITQATPSGPAIFVFPAFYGHDDFTALLGADTNALLGAGFVNFETMTCVGKSLSLALSSRPEDTALLRRHAFPA